MGRRGLGHIETILAFVIFLGFLGFAFFFFSPFSGNRVLDSTAVYTFTEIQDNVSVSVETYSVIIDPGIADLELGIALESGFSTTRAHVADREGNRFPAGYDASQGIVFFERSRSDVDFVTVRLGEGFTDDGVSSGKTLAEENYSISSSDATQLYSEQAFFELNDVYDANYVQLKKRFNLPNRVDFGFIVQFDDGTTISAERTIPESLEVVADNERVEIIRRDGSVGFADLTWKVW